MKLKIAGERKPTAPSRGKSGQSNPPVKTRNKLQKPAQDPTEDDELLNGHSGGSSNPYDKTVNLRAKPPIMRYPMRPPAGSQYRMQPGMPGEPIQRAMVVGNMASPFGCCNFFDICADDIMALHYSPAYGGIPNLLDWMNFEVGEECIKVFEYITYVGAAGLSTAGAATAGHLADPCEPPNGIEFGTCKLTLEDFGRYGRLGPTRTFMKPERYCQTSPQYRLDGRRITSEYEWDIRLATDTLVADLLRDVIVGDDAVAGKMDGLQQWVHDDYACTALNSKVVDWNANGANGGSGVTINGVAIASTWGLIDVLLDLVRYIRTRISWSPMLRNQTLRIGDIIIATSSHMTRCILDAFTCWSVCAGRQYNETNLNTYEARRFREQLDGGLFGFGEITLDGIRIPLLAHDWELLNADGTSDIYLLTGAVGSQRLWQGEFLSAENALRNYGIANLGYRSLDGGRLLVLTETENECILTKLWTHPRIFTKAPWANAVIQDVACSTPLGPLSADPEHASFYIQSSFGAAVCP